MNEGREAAARAAALEDEKLKQARPEEPKEAEVVDIKEKMEERSYKNFEDRYDELAQKRKTDKITSQEFRQGFKEAHAMHQLDLAKATGRPQKMQPSRYETLRNKILTEIKDPKEQALKLDELDELTEISRPELNSKELFKVLEEASKSGRAKVISESEYNRMADNVFKDTSTPEEYIQAMNIIDSLVYVQGSKETEDRRNYKAGEAEKALMSAKAAGVQKEITPDEYECLVEKWKKDLPQNEVAQKIADLKNFVKVESVFSKREFPLSAEKKAQLADEAKNILLGGKKEMTQDQFNSLTERWSKEIDDIFEWNKKVTELRGMVKIVKPEVPTKPEEPSKEAPEVLELTEEMALSPEAENALRLEEAKDLTAKISQAIESGAISLDQAYKSLDDFEYGLKGYQEGMDLVRARIRDTEKKYEKQKYKEMGEERRKTISENSEKLGFTGEEYDKSQDELDKAITLFEGHYKLEFPGEKIPRPEDMKLGFFARRRMKRDNPELFGALESYMAAKKDFGDKTKALFKEIPDLIESNKAYQELLAMRAAKERAEKEPNALQKRMIEEADAMAEIDSLVKRGELSLEEGRAKIGEIRAVLDRLISEKAGDIEKIPGRLEVIDEISGSDDSIDFKGKDMWDTYKEVQNLKYKLINKGYGDKNVELGFDPTKGNAFINRLKARRRIGKENMAEYDRRLEEYRSLNDKYSKMEEKTSESSEKIAELEKERQVMDKIKIFTDKNKGELSEAQTIEALRDLIKDIKDSSNEKSEAPLAPISSFELNVGGKNIEFYLSGNEVGKYDIRPHERNNYEATRLLNSARESEE